MRFVSRAVPFVVLTLAAAVGAQESKSLLTLYVETTKFAVPGLENLKLPPEAARAFEQFQMGTRSLRVDLHAPVPPPPAPEANLDIPDTLKLGKTLPLEVPKPGGAGKDDKDPVFGGNFEKMEMRRYWSCGAMVKPGQPKVAKAGSLSPEQLERARAQRGQAPAAANPKDTRAYWPNARDRSGNKPIDGKAALPGKYQLRTNFAGGVGFEIPTGVEFMGPINATPSTQELSKAITLSWKPVEGAVAYLVMAFGMKGKEVMIMWNSADSDEGSEAGYVPTAEIKAQVEKGILLAPGKTECTIPAGIFEGCQNVSVMLHAYGPGHYQAAPLAGMPNVRVVTRSVAMIPLGVDAKAFGGFGN